MLKKKMSELTQAQGHGVKSTGGMDKKFQDGFKWIQEIHMKLKLTVRDTKDKSALK